MAPGPGPPSSWGPLTIPLGSLRDPDHRELQFCPHFTAKATEVQIITCLPFPAPSADRPQTGSDRTGRTSLSYSFSKYLLNIYCVPGHLGTGDTTVNELNASPPVSALRRGGGRGGAPRNNTSNISSGNYTLCRPGTVLRAHPCWN